MSMLGDVRELYGSIRGTWSDSRAHLIAHLVFFFVVFVLFGATTPNVAVPRLDPRTILDNDWFKLAKESGVIYASFVIPFVLVAAYGAILGRVGQAITTLLLLVLQPRTDVQTYRLLSPPALLPIALTLNRVDFQFSDLLTRSTELMNKYRANSEFKMELEKTFGKFGQDNLRYLSDYVAFLVGWTVLFSLARAPDWVTQNQTRFWPVALTLVLLAWLAWIRVVRTLRAMPQIGLMSVTGMILRDPDMPKPLSVDAERREQVLDRLEEVLREERQRTTRRPLLRKFLAKQFSIGRTAEPEQSRHRQYGWPFRSLYEQGLEFKTNKDLYEDYSNPAKWLRQYGAYLYHQLWRRVSSIAQLLRTMFRVLITGGP